MGLIITVLLLLLASPSYADDAILEINIGGSVYKDVIVNTKTFVLVEDIKVGKCKTKNLKDFGEPIYLKDKSLILVSQLKSECLDNQTFDLSFQNTFTPIKSTSFFLNISPELGLNKDSSAYFRGGVHAFDTFLYTTFSYAKDEGNYKFKRDYTYIERDIDDWKSVVRFGDTYANTSSFLVDAPSKSIGLLLQRKWALDPTIKPFNTISKQLTLTSKSTVELLQNGNVIYRIELNPGNYNLSSLPTQGLVGTYTVRVTDAFGKVTETTEQYVASQDMLKKGMFDYSVFLSDKYAGYLRYGLMDNLTVGLHGSKNMQSISVDYLSVYGQSSLELSIKGDYRLAHTYQQDNIAIQGAITRKDDSNTFALGGSYAADNYGTFSARLEKSDKTKIGVGYSKTFYGVNTSANINSDGEFLLNGSYTLRVLGRNGTVGASLSHTKTDNKVYAYFQIPLEDTDKTWGVNTRVSKSKDSTSIDADISGRYLFDYALKNNYNSTTSKVSSSLALNSGVGCVKQNGDFKCGLGSYVGDGQGFVVADGTVKIEGRERTGLNTISTYRDVAVSSTSEIVETEVKIATRAGQGVLIPKQVLVFGKIKANPIPTKITINREEIYVTDTGEFSVTTTEKKLSIVLNGKTIIKEVKTNEEIVRIEIDAGNEHVVKAEQPKETVKEVKEVKQAVDIGKLKEELRKEIIQELIERGIIPNYKKEARWEGQ